MTTRQTPDAVREALRAQHDWHYEKAKALSKQPQTADVQWRRNEHREQIDAIAFALSALDSRAGDAGDEKLYDIVLASEDIAWGGLGGGGYQLHGLFASYKDAALHVIKDEALAENDAATLLEEWRDGTVYRHTRGVRSEWWTATRQPIRATPAPAPAVDAQESDEGPCTDCRDTGITIQTERACSCEAGDQYRPPAVDAAPAGEGERLARIRTSMALLQQNSEACAHNHYGDDTTLHGMPGWLIDTKADLDAFTDLLAKWEADRG